MKLLIVESPSKAKTIEKYLEGEYTVRASVGHVRDLPKSNKKAIDIPAGFIPHYEISKGKEKVVDELQSLAEKAKEIFLAPDPDREGEAIAWHIESLLKEDKKVKAPIKRVTFNEITKEAVTEALQHPRDIDTDLRQAQEARRVLDRLVGYDLSGIIWQKVRYGLSAGRVQSPALRILVEREREIRAFIPEDYWVLQAKVKTQKGAELTLTCTEEPRDRKEVDRILDVAQKEEWIVKDVKESEQKRSPKAPFTTSTLQQAASSRLGFSPARTMQVAQKLYEAGHITYMRTDSTTLSEQAIPGIIKIIEKEHGKNYAEVRTYKTKAKNAQEAHEAVRPTHPEKGSAGNTEEQKKLYRLIWERTISSQMADAKVLKTRVVGNVKSDSIPDFTVTGSQVLFPGWLAVDTDARGEDVELPAIAQGEALKLISIEDIAKQTEPPNRYSEAGLVKELEARGIGRPSTYASIMKTLEDRGYVEKVGRSLKPTDTGEVVSSFLEQNFMNYISDTFTAEMENELDDIANGDRQYKKVLSDFYTPFLKEVKEKQKLDKATTLEKADPKYKCPKCGSPMVVKLGRGGKFLSCERYPDCDGALTIDGLEIKKDEPIGIDPETNLPIFTMIGRFGPYVQLGEMPPKVKGKKQQKPRMASIPKEVDPTTVTVEMALKYLSLPRTLGKHPTTDLDVTANNGRFGPYVAHDGNFRSIKPPLDVYTITLEQALELLAQEKRPRGFQRKKKEE
ncbi:MAG TPA: type I DNA topoisomerase [Candidatus Paceibacterota bacterium]|jgi:DNA topoisomerase-1|nr:type I DNA topoisomerase [Candidatus Paceibacterota bacterium]